MTAALPEGLLVAWYGDDFTGAAAVMEVLAFAGLASVLFLEIPSPEQMTRFPGLRGIGIAGTARARDPDWMRANLPAVFRFLKSLQAPVTQYKICSTLDSSPEIGSIGTALEIGQEVFQPKWMPLLPAAPAMQRFQVYGQMFAAHGGQIHRLDRHPVMARHPVTPMHEADTCCHLARQTSLPLGLITLDDLTDANAAKRALDRVLAQGAQIVALDCRTDADLSVVGGLIWDSRAGPMFCAGSQGVESALVQHWVDEGALLPRALPAGIGRAGQMVVVSGSVSSVTAEQINHASAHGFAPLRLDPIAVLNAPAATIEACVQEALRVVLAGQSPLVFTALGPDDPAVRALADHQARTGLSTAEVSRKIGAALGGVLRDALARAPIRRAVIAGGDTSGYAMSALGIFALTAIAPTIPGAAICRAHSTDTRLDGIEIALKGGQMGTRDYFDWIRCGGGERAVP